MDRLKRLFQLWQNKKAEGEELYEVCKAEDWNITAECDELMFELEGDLRWFLEYLLNSFEDTENAIK